MSETLRFLDSWEVLLNTLSSLQYDIATDSKVAEFTKSRYVMALDEAKRAVILCYKKK